MNCERSLSRSFATSLLMHRTHVRTTQPAIADLVPSTTIFTASNPEEVTKRDIDEMKCSQMRRRSQSISVCTPLFTQGCMPPKAYRGPSRVQERSGRLLGDRPHWEWHDLREDMLHDRDLGGRRELAALLPDKVEPPAELLTQPQRGELALEDVDGLKQRQEVDRHMQRHAYLPPRIPRIAEKMLEERKDAPPLARGLVGARDHIKDGEHRGIV